MSNSIDELDVLKEQSAYFEKLMEPIIHNPAIDKMNAALLPIKLQMAEMQTILPVIDIPIGAKQSLINLATTISTIEPTSFDDSDECLNQAHQDLVKATESFVDQAPTKVKESLTEKVLSKRSEKLNIKEFISTVSDILTTLTVVFSSPISPNFAMATSAYIQQTESITVNVIVESPDSQNDTNQNTDINVTLNINHSD
ncbi:hypothetical protein [Eubacterium maltosivorans]|uniref:hypothetical protein n=1 Tax=Eubacterium maltosivorans TaxID=2041044 RepID=UPI00189E7C56|nr:hypothetical protein [Eubacterium maltosivorans]